VAEVAVLGAGRMGSAMATRVAAAGHTVRVWNRSPQPAEAAAAADPEGRTQAAATAADAVAGADVVLAMLADGSATCAVLLDTAVLAALREEMQGLDIREVQAGVRPGDEVELAAGPMRGLRGIVDSVRDGARRVRILMEFLGRDNLVEVDAGKLLGGQRPRDQLASGG